MSLDSTTELEAKAAIREVMEEFKAAPHLAKELCNWLVVVFKKWEKKSGVHAPRRGVLARLSFESAKLYQRTQDFTPSYAHLAFKLLHDKYPQMLEVEDKFSLRRILAGAVLVEANDTPVRRDGLHRALEVYRQYRLIQAETQAEIYKEEFVTGHFRQRAIARRPRTDALQSLIDKIVKGKPRITVNEMQEELERPVHKNVIDEIAEGTIHFIERNDRGGYSAPVSGLKDRIGRARKKLVSR